MTDNNDKKEILSSDEKGAAKSTLGGAVAGAVVGTAVGTPVVGTLIGAVSGAVMAARKRRAKSSADRTEYKGKDISRKKASASKSCGEEVEVDAKAKGGHEVRKELDTKGDKAGNEKRWGYVWSKTRQTEVIAETTQLRCGPNRKSVLVQGNWLEHAATNNTEA